MLFKLPLAMAYSSPPVLTVDKSLIKAPLFFNDVSLCALDLRVSTSVPAIISASMPARQVASF